MTDKQQRSFTGLQKSLIVATLLSAFTGIGVGLLRHQGLDGSALLYIGMPTIIALAFATLPAAGSITGSTMKAITFVILISGPLLQEGFICMVMAAPILYMVGALAAWPFEHYRKKRERGESASRLNAMIVPSLLLLMSMEGTVEEFTVDRHNVVERSLVIESTIPEIKNRIGAKHMLVSPDSLFMKLFPRPEVLQSEGLSVGDRHWADLSYYKWIYWNEKKGRVQFEVVENQPRYLKFKAAGDDSYVSSYLDWGDTEVFFLPIDKYQTQVAWRIAYQRKIDPAWYVQPLQHYAVGSVAETFLLSLK